MSLGIVAAFCVFVIAVAARVMLKAWTSQSVRRRMTASPSTFEIDKWVRSVSLPVSQAKYEKQLPVVLDAIARSIYSGSGFTQALREASVLDESPVCTDLKLVVHEVDFGLPVVDALQTWARRRGYQSVRVATAAMSLAVDVGGNQAQAIDAASAAVRRTVEAASIARTYSTDARVSSLAIVVMPLFISGPMLIFSRSARHFMFLTPLGWICLIIGIGFDVLGAVWMRSLAKRALA
jgi:tight adherence protein B